MARGRKGRGQRPSTFPKPEREAQRSPPAPGDLEARLAALSSGVSRAREESESRASTTTRRRRLAVVAAALAVLIGTVGLILGTVGSSHSPKSIATGSSRPTATTVAVSGSTTPAATTAPLTTTPPTTAAPPSTTPSSTAPPSPATTPPSTAKPPPAGPAHVTVRAGDNFWTIARAHEQHVLRHQPTDAQTGHYWVELVAANTSQLVHPGNPNLIYPGQTLVLPV